MLDLVKLTLTHYHLTAFLGLFLQLFSTFTQYSITTQMTGRTSGMHVAAMFPVVSSLCNEPLLSWRQTQFADSASL